MPSPLKTHWNPVFRRSQHSCGMLMEKLQEQFDKYSLKLIATNTCAYINIYTIYIYIYNIYIHMYIYIYNIMEKLVTQKKLWETPFLIYTIAETLFGIFWATCTVALASFFFRHVWIWTSIKSLLRRRWLFLHVPTSSLLSSHRGSARSCGH